MITNELFDIKLPIVPTKKPFKIKLVRYVSWGIILLFFFLFAFIKDSNNIIGTSFLCAVALMLIIPMFLKKEYQYYTKDFIAFNVNHILVNIDNKETLYQVKNLKKISITYIGYRGKYNPITSMAESGFENSITLDDLKYTIYISADNIDPLNYLLRSWKLEHQNVLIKNMWGREMNVLSV